MSVGVNCHPTMDSLSETFGSRTVSGRRRRLYLGAVLLLVGLVVAALGLANVATGLFAGLGVPSAFATKLGLVLAGLLAPVVLVALLARLSPGTRLRIAAGVGVLFAALSLPLFWLSAPAGWQGDPGTLPLETLGVYLVGVSLAFFAVVTAAAVGVVTKTERRRPTGSSQRRPAGRGQGSGMVGEPQSADGGEEDDDLAFPLDDSQ